MKQVIISILLILSLSVCAQKFQPTWESIDARPTPEWFQDAKFGVFICWGLYSVPAWSPAGQYSEWYQYWLQQKSHGGQVTDFHNRTYGEDFEFKDFAPMFKAELFDADEWAELFDRAGAKYVVFTTKHHSGYTMWPSKEAEQSYGVNYNPAKVGPMRDLTGEICEAVREKGIRAGLYYSLYEWYHPLYKTDVPRFVEEHFHPQFKDLVSRYTPDIIWTDGEWEQTSATWRSTELLSWWFNNAPNIDDLVINDRWGNDCRHIHGGFYTTEYGSGMDDASHVWEESRGMGHSYGYNRAENIEHYRSSQELILMLVDLVSRGGNLCLDIGPKADGSIPVIMQERLLQIGNWLKINGEAIYGTRMWKKSCQWSEGERSSNERGQYMTGFDILKETVNPDPGQAVKEIFFTSKENTLYAICPKWPGKKLIIKDFKNNNPASPATTPRHPASPATTKRNQVEVQFLQTAQKLKSTIENGDLHIILPEFDSSLSKQATYVFKIVFKL
ncbi:MAG: alpha-L-fucosidase [Bacteroidetes bacterium]|jgi:alpha-L-fucosidase|nr:alpha-L-fucosidase [Bacteroidota bacterium]MBT4398648.1 alpha-L-fucosidase [Bacteroidota bacterium]MBT4409849.1 alpha-L-fucosidase [Bacteroidota bacterium]MBT7093313.1 alpha-L-fucosidase [Bacteroidota bacterium]MBT7464328.1 alpha-L-fucosidase [Bacteroidota bacterium]